MLFSTIVKLLEDENNLPIKPERIVKLLREGGAVEQVMFIGVNLNTSILRGNFVRVMFDETPIGPIPNPYASSSVGLVAKVYYARNQPQDYIRLVVNKELLHIIDPIVVRTSNRDQIIALADRMRLPTELLVSTQNGSNVQALIDYLGDYRAVVAMVPQSIRDQICEKHAQNKIEEEQIAALTGLPLKYVPVILSEQWHVIRAPWTNMPK